MLRDLELLGLVDQVDIGGGTGGRFSNLNCRFLPAATASVK